MSEKMSVEQEGANNPWEPYRPGIFLYVVKQLAWADFLGAAYRYAKSQRGRVLHFWTRKGAQRYADELNAALDRAREVPREGE